MRFILQLLEQRQLGEWQSRLNRSTRLVVCVLVFLSATVIAKSAQADGKELYVSKDCVSCHGQNGRQPIALNYPKLAGQNAVYIVAQLRAYQDRSRSSALAKVMWPFADALSKKEVLEIAAYLAALK